MMRSFSSDDLMAWSEQIVSQVLPTLVSFVPRTHGAISKINSVEEKIEGLRAEGDPVLVRLGGGRPGEGAHFEAFFQNTDSSAIVLECLKTVAAFIGEEEQGSGFETLGHELIGEGDEAVVGLAHVAGLEAEVDLEMAGESHHERPPFRRD